MSSQMSFPDPCMAWDKLADEEISIVFITPSAEESPGGAVAAATVMFGDRELPEF